MMQMLYYSSGRTRGEGRKIAASMGETEERNKYLENKITRVGIGEESAEIKVQKVAGKDEKQSRGVKDKWDNICD